MISQKMILRDYPLIACEIIQAEVVYVGFTCAMTIDKTDDTFPYKTFYFPTEAALERH